MFGKSEFRVFFDLVKGMLMTSKDELDRPLGELARSDLEAFATRDPACPSPLHALLFYQGFLGVQVKSISLTFRNRHSYL